MSISAVLPKAVLLLRFHLFAVRCCSIFKCFKCFNFNTSVSDLFNSVKVTELPLVEKELLTRLITCNFIVC